MAGVAHVAGVKACGSGWGNVTGVRVCGNWMGMWHGVGYGWGRGWGHVATGAPVLLAPELPLSP